MPNIDKARRRDRKRHNKNKMTMDIGSNLGTIGGQNHLTRLVLVKFE
jgi:hypothetical protein